MGGKGCPELLGVKGAQAEGQAGFESSGLSPVRDPELFSLRAGEGSGIPGVAVKCVDIRKNTSGESGFPDRI